jgi:hypothetical protein
LAADLCKPIFFIFTTKVIMTKIKCPKCESFSTEAKHTGRTTGSAVGAVAGGIGGIAGAWRGARVGLTAGAMAGPAGALMGTIAGALLGGAVGMAAGSEVGGGLGGLADDHLLDNRTCLDCGYDFRHDVQAVAPLRAAAFPNLNAAN